MKLIIFDDNKNITYFGECKLQFFNKKEEKYLKLIMLDKEPQETITSSFEQTYICKNNFLCCMDQESDQRFICAFSTKESCEKIYNAIVKVKSKQSQLPVTLDEDEIFKSDIFIPLIKQVQAGIDGHEDLKAIILDFVNSLNADERLVYLNVLTNTFMALSSIAKTEDSEKSAATYNTPSRSFSSSMNIRKRPLNNISYKESDDEYCDTKKAARRKSSIISCFNEPSPKNSSDDVIFDIVEYLQDEKLEKRILVFTSAEQKKCYEFSYRHSSNFCKCVHCFAERDVIAITSIIHDDGSKTYNFDTDEHVCQPIDYEPSNYQSSLIIKSPNFKFIQRYSKGNVRPFLIIFDSNDLCYKFGFDSRFKSFYCTNCKIKGTIVNARFIQHDGENAIELGRSQHVCKPKKYVPEDL